MANEMLGSILGTLELIGDVCIAKGDLKAALGHKQQALEVARQQERRRLGIAADATDATMADAGAGAKDAQQAASAADSKAAPNATAATAAAATAVASASDGEVTGQIEALAGTIQAAQAQSATLNGSKEASASVSVAGVDGNSNGAADDDNDDDDDDDDDAAAAAADASASAGTATVASLGIARQLRAVGVLMMHLEDSKQAATYLRRCVPVCALTHT